MFEWMKSLIEEAGYTGLFVLVFIENLFPPIPSEIVIPFGGFLVAEGELSFSGVVLAGTLGSVIGALPLYYLGRYWNRDRMKRFFAGKGKWLMVSDENLDRSFRWFERHGSWTVLLCRMVPGLRSYISIPAGAARMPMLRFLALTTAGTALWTALLTWLGLVLGNNYDKLGPYLNIATWAVTIVFVLGVAWWIVRQRRGVR